MVRYGVLGFGHHGVKRLIPAFDGAKQSTLVGIWRRDAQKARVQAREFGIAEVFLSAEDLCASPEIDAVLVSSPDAMHMHDTLLAISHGKPVLCEKPAAVDTSQVRQMAASAQKANVTFGIAQNFRFNRSVNLVRDWLRQGKISRPILATAQFCFRAEYSPRKWIYDPALACGGVIGDVGVHCIDTLRYVLADEICAIETLARGDTGSKTLETSALVSAEFARGALASIQVSFRADYHTYLEVTGEEGVIQSDDCLTVDHPVQVLLRQNGKVAETEEVANDDAYSVMLDAFSAAIHGQATYAAPGEDAVRNQLALDAAFASMRSGRKHEVEVC
jgi:predicted dehydrogenase